MSTARAFADPVRRAARADVELVRAAACGAAPSVLVGGDPWIAEGLVQAAMAVPGAIAGRVRLAPAGADGDVDDPGLAPVRVTAGRPPGAPPRPRPLTTEALVELVDSWGLQDHRIDLAAAALAAWAGPERAEWAVRRWVLEPLAAAGWANRPLPPRPDPGGDDDHDEDASAATEPGPEAPTGDDDADAVEPEDAPGEDAPGEDAPGEDDPTEPEGAPDEDAPGEDDDPTEPDGDAPGEDDTAPPEPSDAHGPPGPPPPADEARDPADGRGDARAAGSPTAAPGRAVPQLPGAGAAHGVLLTDQAQAPPLLPAAAPHPARHCRAVDPARPGRGGAARPADDGTVIGSRPADGALDVGATLAAGLPLAVFRDARYGPTGRGPHGRAPRLLPQDVRLSRHRRRRGRHTVLVLDTSSSVGARRAGQVGAAAAGILDLVRRERGRITVVHAAGEQARVVVAEEHSPTRARAAIDVLPAGGTTPLAHALALAADRAAAADDAAHARAVIVTDGRPTAGSGGDPTAEAAAALRRLTDVVAQVSVLPVGELNAAVLRRSFAWMRGSNAQLMWP